MATVLCNAGRAILTNLLSGSGSLPIYTAWGTGAGTAAVADTTLFTESADESRTSGTATRVTTSVTNDTYQVVGLMTCASSGKTITNAGLFDASSAGNMLIHGDFTGVVLAVSDSISFTIKLQF